MRCSRQVLIFLIQLLIKFVINSFLFLLLEFLLNMLFNMKLLGMFNEHLFVSIHDALNAIKDKSTVLSN